MRKEKEESQKRELFWKNENFMKRVRKKKKRKKEKVKKRRISSLKKKIKKRDSQKVYSLILTKYFQEILSRENKPEKEYN